MGVYTGIAQDNVTINSGTMRNVAINNSTLNSSSKSLSNLRSGFSVGAQGGTIGTGAGNVDEFVIVPTDGSLSGVDFSGVDALAASDTNFITFSITNLGQTGAGTTAMLAATDANTTKTTGGAALVANARRTLNVHGTAANLLVTAGDRLRVRAAVTGTLANSVTKPAYNLNFTAA